MGQLLDGIGQRRDQAGAALAAEGAAFEVMILDLGLLPGEVMVAEGLEAVPVFLRLPGWLSGRVCCRPWIIGAMPRRMTDFRGLAESSRVRLLGAVQQAPGSTLKELADRTGLHVNTARDHLTALANEGLVSVQTGQASGRGRPPLLYSPVIDPATNQAARGRVVASRQTTARVKPVLRTASQGAPLTDQAAHQLDLLYEHLNDTGLQPESADDVLEVKLVPCPHFRLVFEDPDFACEVHRRLVRDTLAQVAGPIELEELAPFDAPNACHLRLRVTQ
ncbi:MAG: helix-turn-helix domain-containing protein [Brooklawnia sp.]|nr:helix-turn-helix domain-containing protein [Brooklawnia sp.]